MGSSSRRSFLASVAGTIAIGASQPRAAYSASNDWIPDHVVAVGDDEDELKKYQPQLVTNREDRQKMIGVYGWYADSQKYETRAYNYWLKYTHQDSLLDMIPFIGESLSKDAHLGDHEPFTAFVDTETGEVQEVVYTGYHHYAVHLTRDEIPLSSYVLENRDTHTPLNVVTPHHHYRLAGKDRGVVISNITSMNSFVDVYESWDDLGIWDSSDTKSVTDPWVIKDRGHWWKDGSWDQRFARLRLAINWRDAEGRDALITD